MNAIEITQHELESRPLEWRSAGTGLCSCRVRGVGSCTKHLTVESYMVIYASNSYTYYQWCIAKNGGGYTQTGVAKGLKVPCLFMITEVSIRCQKNHGGWYTPYTRVYPPIHHCSLPLFLPRKSPPRTSGVATQVAKGRTHPLSGKYIIFWYVISRCFRRRPTRKT